MYGAKLTECCIKTNFRLTLKNIRMTNRVEIFQLLSIVTPPRLDSLPGAISEQEERERRKNG